MAIEKWNSCTSVSQKRARPRASRMKEDKGTEEEGKQKIMIMERSKMGTK